MIRVDRNRIDYNVPITLTEFNPLRIFMTRYGLPYTALEALRILVMVTHGEVEKIIDAGKNPLTHERTIRSKVWKLCQDAHVAQPTSVAKLTENVVFNHVKCYLADYGIKQAIGVGVTDFASSELFFINPNAHPNERYCSLTLGNQLSKLKRIRYLYKKPMYSVKELGRENATLVLNAVAAVFPLINDYTLEQRAMQFARNIFLEYGRIGFAKLEYETEHA